MCLYVKSALSLQVPSQGNEPITNALYLCVKSRCGHGSLLKPAASAFPALALVSHSACLGTCTLSSLLILIPRLLITRCSRVGIARSGWGDRAADRRGAPLLGGIHMLAMSSLHLWQVLSCMTASTRRRAKDLIIFIKMYYSTVSSSPSLLQLALDTSVEHHKYGS